MAVEDIPPRRVRGLGRRFDEIREATPEYRPSVAAALYGGEVTATSEEVEESLKSIARGEETILPPPEYKRRITQSRRSSRAVKRPDLYSEFYDAAGAEQSTRVWAMQWVPTAAIGELVMGDLLVVFARTTGVNGGRIFVYTDVVRGVWEQISEYSASYGKAIGNLPHYHVLEDHDKLRYRTLHAKTDEGMPWEDWIWDKEDVWAGGRPDNESGTYSAARAAIRKTSAARRAAKRK